FGELLGEQARHQVGAAAGRVGRDHGDGAGRIILRMGAMMQHHEGGDEYAARSQQAHEQTTQAAHAPHHSDPARPAWRTTPAQRTISDLTKPLSSSGAGDSTGTRPRRTNSSRMALSLPSTRSSA